MRAALSSPAFTPTLTIGLALEPHTFDPAGGMHNPDLEVMSGFYDQLVRVASDGATLRPDLAIKWSVSKSGTTYTFILRKNVTFSDGEKLTPADVVFCLNRARAPHQLWSWTLGAIRTMHVVDKHTVRIILKHPWAPFLSDLSFGDAAVYPSSYFRKHGASYLAGHPMGTGPYALRSWRRGRALELIRNPRSWESRLYPIKRVVYDIVPNDNLRIQMAETGLLDVAADVPPSAAATIQRIRGVRLQSYRSEQVVYLLLNNRVKPFSDVRVRQAIAHAIDRTVVMKAAIDGLGSPASSVLPAGALYFDASVASPVFDPALAGRLLRHSSVPRGFATTMEVASGDTEGNAIASLLQTELSALHIQLRITQVDAVALFSAQENGAYHLSVSGWSNDIPDPDELVSFALDSTLGSRSFYTGYINPAVTRLVKQAESSSVSATRRLLYKQIQEIWAQDQPFIALYDLPYLDVAGGNVRGFFQTPLGMFNLAGVKKT